MEPLGRFLEYSMESLESILKAPLGQTLGQKPSGPAAPRVFGLGSGLGGPSIFSLGTPLRTLGNLPRGSIHHYTPSAFPQIVPDASAPPGVLPWVSPVPLLGLSLCIEDKSGYYWSQ